MRRFAALMIILMLAVTGCSSTGTSERPAEQPVASPTSFVQPLTDDPEVVPSLVWKLVFPDGVLRHFPTTILFESQRLPANDVIAIWEELLDGTALWAGADTIVELCSDQDGYWRPSPTLPQYAGAVFKWSVEKRPEDRWNHARLKIQIGSYFIDSALSEADGALVIVELRPPDSDGKLIWHGIGGTESDVFTKGEPLQVIGIPECTDIPSTE